MNRLELLRVFTAAAQAPSFREAAVRLAVSPQVVTRAVNELERQIGEPLFHRNTRQKRLTARGEQLAAGAHAAIDSVDRLFGALTRPDDAAAAGLVRLTAPGAIGRHMLVDALAPLLAAHPGLHLDLRLSEAHADAVDDRIDLGVRFGRVRDQAHVARPAGRLAFFVCAAPALLQRTGTPQRPEQLMELPCTALIDRNTGRPWPYLFAEGRAFTHPAPAFTTDDPEAECAAVLAGLAFAQLPSHLAVPPLRDGRLVQVLAAQAPPPWPVVVYRPRRTPVPRRVRLVFDRLVAALGDERWLPLSA